jgi:glycine/D-amino acid oxidase-like deaminating enzyme
VSQLAAKLVELEAVNLQTNTPVTSIDQDEAGTSLLRTPRGTLKAKKVVFATNAWTSGICPAMTRKIVPCK